MEARSRAVCVPANEITLASLAERSLEILGAGLAALTIVSMLASTVWHLKDRIHGAISTSRARRNTWAHRNGTIISLETLVAHADRHARNQQTSTHFTAVRCTWAVDGIANGATPERLADAVAVRAVALSRALDVATRTSEALGLALADTAVHRLLSTMDAWQLAG
jgi:hypothetical protein